jgi:hypothetical protein
MDNKRKRILSPKNQKGEKIMKQPLFKMFMNDSNRKLHLLKHNISNSKDSSFSNQNENSDKKKIQHKNMHLNSQLFSYKILEAKHNSTPELYLKRTLNILIKRKKCHYVADFNERILSMCQLRDFLKRYYTIEETKERIPKYVSYYKNYLTFFCRPIFVSYITNKKMVRHMEKVAQVFYNENYAEEEKDDKEKSKKKEKNIVIFNKKIKKEIEDGDIYTVVTSEAAMKQIQKMNNKVNKKIMDNPNSNNEKNVIENNINPIKIDEISIYDNNYKITPIKGIDGNIEINTNEIISDLKNKDIIPQTTNSINLLIEELQSKEIKSDSNNIKPENNKEIIKNMHNNCIVIKGGKTTNNINININHLTISQKASSKKDDEPNIISNENKNNNPKNKYIKKFKNSNTNTKERNNNQKSTNENKNELNTDKEKEKDKDKDKDKDKEKHKTKTFTLTLPPPSHNSLSRTNSVVNKNFNQIFPKTINNNNNIKQNIEIKSPSLLKNGYNGTVTSLHKYISFGKGNSSQNQIAKKTLYTNYSNRLSNIFKNMNYGTSKASKNINIVYTKNVGILSGERTRSISSMKNRQKRIIYSSLHFNGSNLHLLNLKNNIGTSKNSEHRSSSTDKRFAEFKMKKDKIPLIKYKEEESKTSKKGLKVKAKHLNLQKLLNVFPKKSNKTRVTDN